MPTYLAFDFGEKRIGTAVGDTITGTARPLATLTGGFEAVMKLVAEWRPAALVVGLPLMEDGTDQRITTLTRKFAKELEARSQLPVHFSDERYSSRAADDLLRDARSSGAMTRRVKKGDRDGIAAKILLEQFLQELS
ncbi:MAG: Holliday junction resolvase RuvX [Stagnimonas sp.]|nr:Holliday junction resolvase RuvX [Stagnimonas sp.]